MSDEPDSPAVAALVRDVQAWERGFRMGRGIGTRAARPYAEGTAGKAPIQLLGDLARIFAPDYVASFNAGFVAGYRSLFVGET